MEITFAFPPQKAGSWPTYPQTPNHHHPEANPGASTPQNSPWAEVSRSL